MTRVDFHCHTKYSKCSNLEPELILKLCKKRGIQGVMICDHDTVKGAIAFKKLLSPDQSFIFIPGIEILTNRGEIIGAWIEENLTTHDFPDVAEEIRERGGMVIVPHPFDKIRGKVFKIEKKDLRYIDAIEVFNSRCIIPNANTKAAQFSDKYSLLQTAGSDAHFSPEVGNAWISFNGSTSLEFHHALKRGETTIGGKNAPLFVHLYTLNHRVKRYLHESKKPPNLKY